MKPFLFIQIITTENKVDQYENEDILQDAGKNKR